MLSRAARLNLKTNFRWVASGKLQTSKNFKLFYRFGENAQPKVGVSIASAQFKQAVLRNKAKRIMFEQARMYYDQLPKNLNLVIMPKAQVLGLTRNELEKEFSYAISNLKAD